MPSMSRAISSRLLDVHQVPGTLRHRELDAEGLGHGLRPPRPTSGRRRHRAPRTPARRTWPSTASRSGRAAIARWPHAMPSPNWRSDIGGDRGEHRPRQRGPAPPGGLPRPFAAPAHARASRPSQRPPGGARGPRSSRRPPWCRSDQAPPRRRGGAPAPPSRRIRPSNSPPRSRPASRWTRVAPRRPRRRSAPARARLATPACRRCRGDRR